jgi:hypothetical protein
MLRGGGAPHDARALLLCTLLALLHAPRPAAAQFIASSFRCPAAATTNTSCLCTSGCSINSEFSYLWSNPQFPAPSRSLGAGARPAARAVTTRLLRALH